MPVIKTSEFIFLSLVIPQLIKGRGGVCGLSAAVGTGPGCVGQVPGASLHTPLPAET